MKNGNFYIIIRIAKTEIFLEKALVFLLQVSHAMIMVPQYFSMRQNINS